MLIEAWNPTAYCLSNGGRLLAAIVLGVAIISEGVGGDARFTATDLRDDCQHFSKCLSLDPHDTECRGQIYTAATKCGFYVSGYREGHLMGLVVTASKSTGHPVLDFEKLRKYRNACIPQNATNGQLIEVFLKYINDRPERLHEPRGNQLYLSWVDAFPCE